jgi:hypothetical protein
MNNPNPCSQLKTRSIIDSTQPVTGGHILAGLFLSLMFAGFALSPAAKAVSPPPDGGYAGFNTVEGTDALFSNTTGTRNTGVGYQVLYYNNGDYNTAAGSYALFSNTSGTENTASGAGALSHNTSGSTTRPPVF